MKLHPTLLQLKAQFVSFCLIELNLKTIRSEINLAKLQRAMKNKKSVSHQFTENLRLPPP